MPSIKQRAAWYDYYRKNGDKKTPKKKLRNSLYNIKKK